MNNKSRKFLDPLYGGIQGVSNPSVRLSSIMKEFPVIASLCNEREVEDLLISNVRLAYIMCGEMKDLPDLIDKIKSASISPLIYLDLINGLSAKEGAVDFIKYYTDAPGIVTTKSNQIIRAHELGLYGVQRYFVYDAFSLSIVKRQIKVSKADMIEILPGVVLDAIRYFSSDLKTPLVVGGFVNNKKRLEDAIHAGAIGVSSSLPQLWFNM